MHTTRRNGSAGAARSIDRATAWLRRSPDHHSRRTSNRRRRGRRTAAIGGVIAGLVAPVAATGPSAVAADPGDGIQQISFEAVNENYVQLGSLASRTQRKPLDVSGIGPYTVRGTDSNTGLEYSFVTDQHYDGSNLSHGGAWTREGDERARRDNTPGTWTSSTNASWLGRDNVLMLKQSINCLAGNTFDGATTYCTIFGPDVYTEAFDATAGQAVSFDWAARRISDDYEVYAFLVEVDETSPGVYDYGTPASHSILAHGRGNDQPWTTSSREITETGTYRFRFVNGSYDQTGGYLLGSEMYIDSVVKVGQANPIDFAPLGDKVVGAAPFTVSATAPGGEVTFSTATTNICTVSGSTVTLTGNTGVCTVVADQAGDGATYVPAESTARSFTVLAAPTAPTNSGTPYISGTLAEGNVLTGNDGTWGDGGSPITQTDRQWRVSNGGTTTDIAGATGSTCFLVASPGDQVSFAVTQTNSVGSTTVASSLLASGYTCGEPEAPAWTDQTLSDALQVGVAYSDGVSATGAPAPTYSVSAGQLPAGLTLNSSTGALTGTPDTAGPFSFTITASNGFGSSLSVSLSGDVAPPDSAPSWEPDVELGDIENGTEVDVDLGAEGFPVPTYTVTAGELPEGLTLDPDTGVLSGTPTGSGPYDFTVTATNGIGDPVSRQFTGVIHLAPSWIGTPSLPAPVVGTSLHVTLAVSGHPAPTFTVTAGELPEGLTLDPDTGVLSGTPTTAGPFEFTITVSNGIGDPLAHAFTGTVNAPAGWTTSALSALVVGTPVTGSFVADGYPLPTYTISAGKLPTGLTLNPQTGAIAGTPTTAGSYSFTVAASNGVGLAATVTMSGTVTQAPSAITAVLAEPVLGLPYQTSVAVDGTPAPVYAVTAGVLPAGITLDAATGTITGIATTPGAYNFTITASNGIGSDTSKAFNGTVADKAVAKVTIDLEVGTKVGGSDVLVEANGLKAESQVSIELHSEPIVLGTPLTDGQGNLSTTVTLPADIMPGEHHVVVKGTTPLGEELSVKEPLVVDWSGARAATKVSGGFTAVDPVRVLDTRSAAPLVAGTAFELDVEPAWGLPDTATAVTVNVTATDTATAGYLTVFPCGADQPEASVLNFAAGQTVANMVVVAVDSSAQLCFTSSAGAHLIVDLNGFHGDEDGHRLATHAPQRALDTRSAAKLDAGQIVTIPVAEPGSAAAAVVNLTVTEPDAAGYLTAFPCGAGVPEVSNLNFAAGQTVANHANVKLDADGELCLYTSAATHVVVDLSGTFGKTGSSALAVNVPGRMYDSRGGAMLPAGSTHTFIVTGDGGAPADTTAMALNVTVTGAAADGYLTVFGCGELPVASNVNFVAGGTMANHVSVDVGSNGEVCVMTSAAIHLLIDVEGTYRAVG